MNTKVILGISGGVDSSVSALLLTEQNYDVTAVFMKNWEEDDTESFCAAEQDIKDASAVCTSLNISFKMINFSAEYWENVFENFLQEHKAGRTPNPDILCNQEIKFKAFLDYAKLLKGQYIATGHYAIHKTLNNGEHQLLKGFDDNKDQSYFLYTLTQKQLKHTIFPLGNLKKETVRAIAKTHNLITYKKKDSTGICFIGEKNFKNFISQYLPKKPGEIHDETGNKIGSHDGVIYYTIGQRKGLKIGGIKNKKELPWYVAKKNITTNILTAVQGFNHSMLFSSALTAIKVNWIKGIPPALSFNCYAKIRYRQSDQSCTVKVKDEKVEVKFNILQRAVTPGQSIVFYDDQICLGGGIIN